MKWRVEGLLPFAGACGGRGFFYIYSVLMNGLTGRFLFVPFLVTCDSTCQGGLPTPKFGRVTTATTCDIDPQCRKVLKSLPEVWSGVVMWLWESWTWRLDTGDSRLYIEATAAAKQFISSDPRDPIGPKVLCFQILFMPGRAWPYNSKSKTSLTSFTYTDTDSLTVMYFRLDSLTCSASVHPWPGRTADLNVCKAA